MFRFFAGRALLVLMCLPLFVVQGSAQESPEAETPPVSETRAFQVLKAASEQLKSAEQFSFTAEVNADRVLRSGQKLQYENRLLVYLRRPNQVRADFEGDRASKVFWYDGQAITLLDRRENLYATTPAPPTVDEALDFAMDTYGVTVPVADLLFSDPYEVLTENVESAVYVGLGKVRGTPCHHLAFTQASIDWQIWIEDGPLLVPRKLVITYKQVPGQPQYTAVLAEWNLSARFSDLFFRFSPPVGAEAIDFLPVAAGQD